MSDHFLEITLQMGTGLSLITEYALGGLIFWSTFGIGLFLSNLNSFAGLTDSPSILTGLVLILSPFVYLTGLLIDIFGNKILQFIQIERNIGEYYYSKIVLKGSNSANERIKGFESTKRFLRISFLSFFINLAIFLTIGCITKLTLLFCASLICLALGVVSFIGYIVIKKRYEEILKELS